MVTEAQETPCEVVEVAPYNEDDAKYGKFVRVAFEGEDGTRRYTLAKSLESLPKVGQHVRLRFEAYMKAVGASDGSGRVFYTEKRRVIAYAVVS